MRKGKSVVGQHVLSLSDGRKIETVKDLVISVGNDSIVALLVDEGGLLSSSKVVPIENVTSFGKDAVVIDDSSAIVSASADPDVKAILDRKDSLLGKKVFTDNGQQLGTVSDMYFDEPTGRILGFEVSGGLFGDIARGISYLPFDDIERLGTDLIFVRPSTGEALESQVGGVQGALNSAGQRMSDLTGEAQVGLAQREPEKALVGRRSGADVTDENGSVVVAKGQRITAEHVDWARANNQVGLLTRAATAGQGQELGERVGSAFEQAGDNAGTLWDRFTARLGEMRDEQGREVDAQITRNRLVQISDAIGRPVGKVILDRKDDVILDFGDIITHQAVQRAYDAGMLDTLLQNVHQAQFAFPPEQMRVGVMANSTVQRASGGNALLEELETQVQETDRQRQEREQRDREQAEQLRQQRATERDQRARQRDDAERQRQAEIERARQSGNGGAQPEGTTSPPPATTSPPPRTAGGEPPPRTAGGEPPPRTAGGEPPPRTAGGEPPTEIGTADRVGAGTTRRS
jgi:uncharacterized protein YrrD